MHVALIGNTAWLDEELPMFRSLVVGLMDEGLRVAQVAPEQVPADEGCGLADLVVFGDTRWSALRALRLANLARPLRELGVDLIHAMDGRLWEGAAALARKMGCGLALSAWSHRDVETAARLAHRIGALEAGVSAGTEPLAEAIREAAGPGMPVEVIGPGVHLWPEPGRRKAGGTLCAVISGAWRYDADYRALFEALRPFVKEHPESIFFLDTQGSRQHLIWRAAREMDLLANVSFTPHRLGHREMLLKADVLIHPQALGLARGLTLQAMARGTPVLARADPWVDYLTGQTAWLVEEADPAAWGAALRRLVERPEEARALGLGARAYVEKHHLASGQVEKTLALYRRVTGESFKFPGG